MGAPVSEEERAERRAAYRRLGKFFLWAGWGVAFLAMWLGSRIIDGLHGRIVELEQENVSLRGGQGPTKAAPLRHFR